MGSKRLMASCDKKHRRVGKIGLNIQHFHFFQTAGLEIIPSYLTQIHDLNDKMFLEEL